MSALEIVRSDALPSYDMLPDTGCEHHPACLTCPFERCRYDEPGGVPAMQRENLDAAIVSAYRVEGMKATQVAERFGISERSVFRILKEANR